MCAPLRNTWCAANMRALPERWCVMRGNTRAPCYPSARRRATRTSTVSAAMAPHTRSLATYQLVGVANHHRVLVRLHPRDHLSRQAHACGTHERGRVCTAIVCSGVDDIPMSCITPVRAHIHTQSKPMWAHHRMCSQQRACDMHNSTARQLPPRPIHFTTASACWRAIGIRCLRMAKRCDCVCACCTRACCHRACVCACATSVCNDRDRGATPHTNTPHTLSAARRRAHRWCAWHNTC